MSRDSNPGTTSESQSGSEPGTDGQAPDLAKIGSLLEKAWEQPEGERGNWLARHCESAELLAEATSLLTADREAGDFLGEDSAQRAMALLQASPYLARFLNREIGNYRIVEPIAHGGMGEVFLGERTEADFEQTVAIKVSRRFDDSEEKRRRFIEEQRILARLEHPNIARLIDGGIWEGDELSTNGRPYLVMEYVAGQPITEYCDEMGLSLADRLDLFCTVCEAVHYAHRNLILHRDIKPANILVSEEGHVKLLDFGIATALAGEESTEVTRSRLMTPEFAAPEQLRGEALTTSTDVYALGLLLYELVCGQRVVDLEGKSPAEVQKLICETAPARPSARAADKSMAHALKGDLDQIVLKALSKEPERRYPSARALAEDIQSFHEGRPVKAQPDSRRYRFAKFLERHRWEAISASVVTALLLAATIVAILSAGEAKRSLAKSRIEAEKSAEVVAFLRDMFAAADPRQTGGEEYSVKDVLASGSQRIDALEGQPEVQGLLLSELGQIHTTLGNYDQAVAMLGQAASLQTEVLGDDHPILAETLHRLAIAEDERGDLAAAEQAASEALRIRQNSLPPGAAEIGESMDRLGAVIAGQGRYDEAEPLMAQAVALLTASAGELDKRTLTALHNMAWLHGRLGDYAESESAYRHVVALAEQAYGPNDPELLVTRDSLAVMLRRQGKLDEAEAIYRDVLARRIDTLGAHHREVGYTQHNLARLLFERGNLDEAVSLFEQALTNWRITLGPDHANLGIGLSNLGRAQEELGRIADAESSYRRSIEILGAQESGFADRLGDTSVRLGRLLTDAGNAQSALPFLQIAVEIRASNPGDEIALAHARMELGNCFLALNETERGRFLLAQSLPVILAKASEADLLARARAVDRRLNNPGT